MREHNGKCHGVNAARICLVSTLALFGHLTGGATQATAEPTAAAERVVPRASRKTVAVTRFDANDSLLARYGGYDVGGGLAEQLASELEGSGEFTVVENAELSNVRREQARAGDGLPPAHTSTQAARLLGAQFLVRSSITDFNETRQGDGHIWIDLRVIDTTTDRVVARIKAQRELGRTSPSIDGVGQNRTRFGYDAFQRSPLGRAAREAMTQAVLDMGRQLDHVPWNAHVTKVRASLVYVNAGANANLYEGEQLDVYRVVDRIEDPDTGEVLGVEEHRIGTVTLGSVQQCYATGTYSGPGRPRVGDNLR